MTGIYTGSWDNPELESMGTALLPSSAGDVLGAAASSAFANNPTQRLISQLPAGTTLDNDNQPVDTGEAPAPTITAEEANNRYAIPGSLTFDQPVTEAAAQNLYESHRQEIIRQDTIARNAGGVLSGGFARGVAGVAVGLLDPINLAAGLVPGVGEARLGALFGESLAGRIAASAVSGATGGAAGMAALEPLNALLDSADHNDWSMAQALRNIAFGGLIGGGLHVLGSALDPASALRNPITARMEAAGYEARDMALRGAVGQLADGRAVDVAPALDLVEARSAEAASLAESPREPGFSDIGPEDTDPGSNAPEISESAPSASLPGYDRYPDDGLKGRIEYLREGAQSSDASESLREDLAEHADRLARVMEQRDAALQGVEPELAANIQGMRVGDAVSGTTKRGDDFIGQLEGYYRRGVEVSGDDGVFRQIRWQDIKSVDRAEQPIRSSSGAIRSAAPDQVRPTADAAANDLIAGAKRPIEQPEDRADAAANAEAVKRAPKIDPDLARQHAELTAQADGFAKSVDVELKAGRLTEAQARPLRDAEEASRLEEGNARAVEAAAACLAAGVP